MKPITRIEATVPAEIGLTYGGRWGSYILEARADGKLYEQVYAPDALRNVMPPTVLDVSSSVAELVLKNGSEVRGIRFFPKSDALYPGYILPFDPFDPMPPADSFIPGSAVDGVVMDCPVQGIPNDAEPQSIVAYAHLRHYVFVTGRYYAEADSAAALAEPIDVNGFFPVLLLDHYQDLNGAWYVLASECLRDSRGNIIISNPPQRRCPLFQ